jgi:hypothetical protein
MSTPFTWPEQLGSNQAVKIRSAFRLLEDNLRPEECDRASSSYRLGWYERLQANQFGQEDLEHFRRFVDEMAERALKRSYRTESLFPSAPPTGLNAERVDVNVRRARELCESLRAGLEEGR